MKTICFGLTAALALLSCGGNEDDFTKDIAAPFIPNSPSKPTNLPDGPVTQVGDDLSRALSVAPGQEITLEFPIDYQGFCSPVATDPNVTNAEWKIEPEGTAGLSLVNSKSCKPTIQIGAGFDDNANSKVTGKLPLANNRTLTFSIRLAKRLAPQIEQPTQIVNLNKNMPQYTGSPQNNFQNGPNYNNGATAEKMRLIVSGSDVRFRDYNLRDPRHFAIPIKVIDPSPTNPMTSDFTYSVACETPGTRPAFSGSPNCSGYCPFKVSIVDSFAVFETLPRSGATTTFFFQKGANNARCIVNGLGASPINLILKVTNPAGTTTKAIGALKIETD